LHTDYALRILLHAAAMPGERLSIGEVAVQHGISRNHVMKVVNLLGSRGFLETTRGRGGGFALARDPADITIGEVVRLTEPSLQPADCASCTLRHACGLVPALDCAMRAFMQVLDNRTLADAARETSLPFGRHAQTSG
jgi:Rrf2 family transcriptional regulator, nitric oxide-sensitive transcriptional repressor